MTIINVNKQIMMVLTTVLIGSLQTFLLVECNVILGYNTICCGCWFFMLSIWVCGSSIALMFFSFSWNVGSRCSHWMARLCIGRVLPPIQYCLQRGLVCCTPYKWWHKKDTLFLSLFSWSFTWSLEPMPILISSWLC